METTSETVQLFGFSFVLASIAFLFIRLVQVLIRGRKAQLRYSVEALAIFSILYYAVTPGLEWVTAAHLTLDIKNGIAFFWWLDLAFLIDTSLRLYAWEGILSDHGKRKVPKIVTAGVSLALYTLSLVIVLHYFFDKPVGALLATSGATALVLGFSAQSTLKEIFSGLALNLTKAVRMGDYVEIDGVYGQIFDINWRSISVKNPHTDSLYVFPNSIAAGKTILNFSEPSGRFKYFVSFVAEASAPPEKVIRAIAKELAYSRHVMREPKPDFNILGFTECGIEIRVRFFFDGDDPWWDAQNEVCMAIWGAMRKHGFKLGIKRAHLGSDMEWLTLDEDVNRRFDNTIEKAIAQNESFKLLNKEQVQTLSESATLLDLNPPSCYYHPGDKSDYCYIVLEGSVGIYADNDNTEVRIELCGPGSTFGLTGMLNSSHRIHLAQCEQYTVAIRLESKVLFTYIEEIPQLKEHLISEVSHKASLRQVYMQEQLMQLHAQNNHNQKNHLNKELRKSVDHLLTQSWIHHITDHLVSKSSHEKFLNAIMAGCALVESNKTSADTMDEAQMTLIFADSNLLKHIDIKHGLEQHAYFADAIQNNYEEGKKTALEAISVFKDSDHKAHIILAIAHGIAQPTKDDQLTLEFVADSLDIENDISQITELMRAKRNTNQR